MRFVLLGPVTIVAGGQRHSLPRAQTRGLLAYLLLNPGRALSREAVAEALWGGAPPASARAQVRNAVGYLRGRLAELGAPDAIATGSFGYRMTVDPELIDASLFARQTERAGEPGTEPAEATRLLRAALDLFWGEPLLDASGAFVDAARARLSDGRLAAVEVLADLQLRLGQADLVATELASYVHEHPLREGMRARLMLALYRSGRQTDALALSREYRQLATEHRGLGQGREIAELERLILCADPSLDRL